MSTIKKTISPHVFISYSHRDEDLKERLLAHLRGVQSLTGALSIWTDRNIDAGKSWKNEIRKSLSESSLAVLLVTADFLASDATRAEVDELLIRREKEGLPIVPVIAKPCLWHEVDWLRSLEVIPKDGTPISSLSTQKLDEVLAEIAQKILSLWEAKAAEPERKANRASNSEDEPEVFISHCHDDGDFAEVLKSKLGEWGYKAWIDIDRLNAGENWREEIDDAIRRSKAVVVVMSPKARESEYTTYEWAFACGHKNKVIPLMIKATSLHPRLESVQYLDFTNRSARPWNKLFDAIDRTRP
ncbi:MAG TPA: toll/interleukin-1 receptor domain-containing protein [Candidatus Hydrogenedentes bacterium]|nr:toll/interleukin-1 receptor domain-containing protein [Candidatus Hydrogenedentota bacterium]